MTVITVITAAALGLKCISETQKEARVSSGVIRFDCYGLMCFRKGRDMMIYNKALTLQPD